MRASRRTYFLIVLQHSGTFTQHKLAVALGYSDPAVSAMLAELVKDGYIQIALDLANQVVTFLERR